MEVEELQVEMEVEEVEVELDLEVVVEAEIDVTMNTHTNTFPLLSFPSLHKSPDHARNLPAHAHFHTRRSARPLRQRLLF